MFFFSADLYLWGRRGCDQMMSWTREHNVIPSLLVTCNPGTMPDLKIGVAIWSALLREKFSYLPQSWRVYCLVPVPSYPHSCPLLPSLNGVAVFFYYASPSSGEAYRDRQLTTNFEFWVEIFCVPTCFHVKIPKPCLSVRLSICPYPEKRNHHSFVNISPTLVIDTSMERSSRVLQHEDPKIWFFFSKKFKIRILTWRRAEITLASSISALH